MAQLVSSKNLLKQASALVVGAISSAAILEEVSQAGLTSGDCDLLELRLDSIDLPIAEVHALASRLTLPLLITARHPDEGGHRNLSTSQRQELLLSHLDLAVLMDIELRSVGEMIPLVQKAQGRGVGVIGSFHDFHTTPNDDVLQGSVDFGLQFKLDAVKIATTLQSPNDLARLLQLISKERRLPLSVMGMGSLGRASRLVLAKSGSILNYGYLGQSNAPGQWAARQLKDLIQQL